jgi:hypothetical protein
MGGEHDGYASRFAESYCNHPAGYPHELIIVSNGGSPTATMQQKFDGIPHRFMEHDDSGFDIGAFQAAAKANPRFDLMLFIGGPSYVKREGWLARYVEATLKHGPGLYGSMGNTGVPEQFVWPHLRTTGFALSPELLNGYPNTVRSAQERYPFEHGQRSLTQWVVSLGLPVKVVTFSAEYDVSQGNEIPDGFHRGDQSGLLVRDRLCDPPYYA